MIRLINTSCAAQGRRNLPPQAYSFYRQLRFPLLGKSSQRGGLLRCAPCWKRPAVF